jgi:hypothetical protein
MVFYSNVILLHTNTLYWCLNIDLACFLLSSFVISLDEEPIIYVPIGLITIHATPGQPMSPFMIIMDFLFVIHQFSILPSL